MEYIYAVLLLHSAKKDVSEGSIRKILEAAGIAVDEIRLKALVAAVKELNIDEILKSSFAVPATPTTVAAPAQSQPQQAPETKKEEGEEKKEGVSEEQLAEGLASLFG
ncbi:MAG: 50S ribosomal protein P1 [Ignisphaera sp.]|nr:50S ribosomal protein P1 [Ignisphaera sp.]MCX8168173.1 50S ribosomal protein P1 [Ignisphaera sp.]MDW8085187.1 50S ribosomal protein P1 [Ignisphaera sp.]